MIIEDPEHLPLFPFHRKNELEFEMKRRHALLALCTAIMISAATVVGVTPADAAGTQASERAAPARIGHGFHARMKAKPGQGDALVAALLEAPVFGNPDCKVFLVGRSKSDPDVVFVTEGWVSEKAHARFTATDGAKAYTARIGGLVAEWTTSDEIPVGGKVDLAPRS